MQQRQHEDEQAGFRPQGQTGKTSGEKGETKTMDPMENAPGAHIKAMGQAAVDVAKEGFAGPGKLHEMAYEGGSMEREAK